MNDFAELFFALDQTNKTNEKIEALVTFIRQASASDRLWMIALFTNRGPKRVISSRYLQEWAVEKSKIPDWLFDETYQVVGDLGETLALILPQQISTTKSSLTEWMLTIQQMAKQTIQEKKQMIIHLWDQLDSKERLVFNKVLIGGFRLGVSQHLLVKALAKATGEEVSIITHRLMGQWDLNTIDPDFLIGSTEAQARNTRPYPFCLAYPLDEELDHLGSPSEWFFEWKWDGIRGQIVSKQEFFTIWSRGEEVVNDRFPELLQLHAILPSGTVLDGEILAYEGDRVLPFQFLQQRIGRKTITPAILKKIPVIFLVYDVLEWKGEDLRLQPFAFRRQILEQMMENFPSQSLLRLSPQIHVKSWEDAKKKRLEARQHAAEGLMLKKLDSIYHVGRRRGDWWKWKVEAYTVDGVLLYAQKGHGWRANVYSDYTFAVWNGDQLIPFAKAYSGLTKKELNEVDRFIKKNTIEKFGPVRSVKPELVFEIAFEGIQISKRHKSGIAVRFPRIQRWRHDKRPEDADTLETLKALIDTPE